MNHIKKLAGCLSFTAMLSVPGTDLFAARNLLISDIDDTIKISGINSMNTAGHAFGTDNEFAGMSILYNGCAAVFAAAGKTEYLTAAPGELDEIGIDFLRMSGFPPQRGDIKDSIVSGRDPMTEGPGEFKARELIRIYEREKPELMILVGDNGEQDIYAYGELMKHVEGQNGAARVYSFIHHVYKPGANGLEIPAGHVPFLTSADLAVQFANHGWLDEAALTRILGEIEYDSGNRELAKQVVPEFMECATFKAWPKLNQKILAQTPDASAISGIYEQVKANVNDLCRNK